MAQDFTLQDFGRRFPDDAACLDHLMKVRFGKTLECPKCRKTGRFARITKHLADACSSCGHHIHPMQGTIFQNTHIPLVKWFYAMYLFATTRHGVPARELQRQLAVSYATAFRMAHLIQGSMAKVDGDRGLSEDVEVGETYIGGKLRRERGRCVAGEPAGFGMSDGDGDVMVRVVPNARRATSEHHILENDIKAMIVIRDE